MEITQEILQKLQQEYNSIRTTYIDGVEELEQKLDSYEDISLEESLNDEFYGGMLGGFVHALTILEIDKQILNEQIQEQEGSSSV